MQRMTRVALLVVALLFAACTDGQPRVRRRALLVGINDYTASRLGAPRDVPPSRDWLNLSGAVTDVGLMKEMLVLRYGFDARDVVTLTDQDATRAAILQAIETHLVRNAGKGDILFFYYAGHGSQVRNSLSDEPDKLDESLVPADSRLGVRDIRDKELRRPFNRILDRGAHLTVMLDNCHSGSGARGLATGAWPRGLRPDLRDARDATHYGPRPEDRGALVLAASQDSADAWEMRDDEGRMHGAFSWAWIRAMRDASDDEPAADTFARAAARLRAEKPYQAPVIAGTTRARLAPFLGTRGGATRARAVVAVKDVRRDGTVLLHGGWAHGLAIGSELRVTGSTHPAARVVVTAVHGLAHSEGRVKTDSAGASAIDAGKLLEIVGWAAPPARPLRVWTPRVAGNVASLASLGERLSAEATRRGIRWTSDPTEKTSSHLLRRGSRGWELLTDGRVETLGPDAADAIVALARIPSGASLFVQFPAPAPLVDALSIGAGSDAAGVAPVDDPDRADYILVGRYAKRRIAYAWVRPHARRSDRPRSAFPLRTAWVTEDPLPALRDSVVRLRRIHGWQTLESPPQSRFPYRLALRRSSDGAQAKSVLVGGERYDLLLRAEEPLPRRVPPRHVYVFAIDSDGNSILLYPAGGAGSVENRVPAVTPPPPVALDGAAVLEVTPPYGVDTYFLLTTDEPLPNPWILEWDGVRGGDATAAKTPLEQLLATAGAGSRSARIVTSANWSLEKSVYTSVSPQRGR